MQMENSVTRNKVAHTHELVYSLVHWLDDEVFEQCQTWQDCLRSGIFTRPEIEKFFGKTKEGEHGNLIGGPGAYSKCVKTGVGREIVAKMLAGAESVEDIRKVIDNFPMTEQRRCYHPAGYDRY